MIGGVNIISDDRMVDGPFEDWSDVRSPGRAARRLKRGFRQRIRLFYRPSEKALKLPDGSLVMHPAMVDALRKATIERKPA